MKIEHLFYVYLLIAYLIDLQHKCCLQRNNILYDLFIYFLKILCNSLANYFFLLLELITIPVWVADLFARVAANVLSEKLWMIEGRPPWQPSFYGFLAIINILSHKTWSETALLVKSLKLQKAISYWNQALSGWFWYIYLEPSRSLNIGIFSLFLLNGM